METISVGRITVPAKIENIAELLLVEKGILSPDQVHVVEVSNALVDTGATYLSMPRRLIGQLGFDKPFMTREAHTTTGIASYGLFGPVRLTIMGRIYHGDVAEVADDCPVLIGQLPLEGLDFVIDPKGSQLIGNPRHGGQHMFEMY